MGFHECGFACFLGLVSGKGPQRGGWSRRGRLSNLRGSPGQPPATWGEWVGVPTKGGAPRRGPADRCGGATRLAASLPSLKVKGGTRRLGRRRPPSGPTRTPAARRVPPAARLARSRAPIGHERGRPGQSRRAEAQRPMGARQACACALARSRPPAGSCGGCPGSRLRVRPRSGLPGPLLSPSGREVGRSGAPGARTPHRWGVGGDSRPRGERSFL